MFVLCCIVLRLCYVCVVWSFTFTCCFLALTALLCFALSGLDCTAMDTNIHKHPNEQQSCDFSNLSYLILVCHFGLPCLAIPLTFVLLPDAKLTDKINLDADGKFLGVEPEEEKDEEDEDDHDGNTRKRKKHKGKANANAKAKAKATTEANVVEENGASSALLDNEHNSPRTNANANANANANSKSKSKSKSGPRRRRPARPKSGHRSNRGPTRSKASSSILATGAFLKRPSTQ